MSNSAPATPAVTSPASSLFTRDVCLPQTRVKTIMKSSPDVENVSQESLFLITKATVRPYGLHVIPRWQDPGVLCPQPNI